MTFSQEVLRCRGMRDLLPENMARVRRVESVFRSTSECWGFREVRTPVIEHLHLFTSAGRLSPQMLGRVYSFLDWDGWSGERVVLRPDATIPVARLYLEHFTGEVAKLFYVENIFRFASPNDDREIWQCGAELIGDTWPLGDVEAVAVVRAVLARLGLDRYAIRLSHTGVLQAILATAGYSADEQLAVYDRILDGDLGALVQVEERLPHLGAPLRLLFDVAGGRTGYIENLRTAFAASVPALAAPLSELETVAATLDAVGCPYELDLTLVRDFEYYTGPVFHCTVNGATIASGGRYDRLITGQDGGTVPACGFALFTEPVATLLPEEAPDRREWSIQIRPARLAPEHMSLALMVAAELQNEGFCADLITPGRSPACRWRLTVDPRAQETRYRLEDCAHGTIMDAGSMEQVMIALGRGARA